MSRSATARRARSMRAGKSAGVYPRETYVVTMHSWHTEPFLGRAVREREDRLADHRAPIGAAPTVHCCGQDNEAEGLGIPAFAQDFPPDVMHPTCSPIFVE